MIKSNTWHDALDTRLCWRFFKYKLVVDEITIKFRRDYNFLAEVRSASRSKDSQEQNHSMRRQDSHPSQSTLLSGSVINSDPPSLSEMPANFSRTPDKWVIPCKLQHVQEKLQELLSDIETLWGPLAEISQMVPGPSSPWLTVVL